MKRIGEKMDQVQPPASLRLMKLRTNNSPATRDSAETSEPPSFERSFERHWPAVYSFLIRIVGDPSEAEDLALETFYRLYRRGDKLDLNFNTGGWLRRVALNLGLQSIRSFRRRLAHELGAGRLTAQDSQADSPLQVLTDREEHEFVRAALGRMREREAQLLLLRYSGASYAEIASTLGVSPTSIGPLLIRAERELARQYRALAQEDL